MGSRGPKPATFTQFWARVNVAGPTECWDWQGEVMNTGYGRFGYHQTRWLAHRFMWMMVEGDPGDMFVCHTCDRPICVNPMHLWLGTNADNIQDMTNKGRGRPGHVPGSKNGRSKLTEAQVGDVRARYEAGETQAALARAYGVKPGTMSAVCRGKSWR